MKKSIFFLLALTFVVATQAQRSLKEALFSGKLKNDSGSVVSSADFRSKIDTSAERMAFLKAKAAAEKAYLDSINKVPERSEVVGITKAIAKGNTTNWKDFVEVLNDKIKTDVLPSPKVKKGNYSVLIDYEIGVTGTVSVNAVTADPDNSFLEKQIQEIITYEAPKLKPELNLQGKPRVVKRKQLLSVQK